MPDDVNTGKTDNRADFFRCCAEFSKSVIRSGPVLMQSRKSPHVWSCGCAWELSALGDFDKIESAGAAVLFVSEDARYLRHTETLPFSLGFRYEFNRDTTPAQALWLLAFYHMAQHHPAVQQAGLSFSIAWHEQRRRYFNWQLSLSAPVCEVRRESRRVTNLASAPDTWKTAFERVTEKLPLLASIAEKLRAEPLVCTEEVWHEFLRWYEANRQGRSLPEPSAPWLEAALPLVGKRVEALPPMLPSVLEEVSLNQDNPISSLRVSTPDLETNFRQWLAAKASVSDKTQSRYLRVLSTLSLHVPELFKSRNITSVYELEEPAAVRSFIDDLKETDWCRAKIERRPGVKHGGANVLVILNHYENYLMTSSLPKESSASKSPERVEMELTLEALLQHPDRVELLTGSKPVFIDTPWGKLDEDKAWRSLYISLWKKAWEKKEADIVSHGSLVTPKSAETYLENSKPYFSLDKQYAVYNNYGIRHMMPQVGKLLVACGVALASVRVRFMTNVETQSQQRTDVALNSILVGPPGTGKTYHTMAYAVAICDGRPVEEVMQQAMSQTGYEALKKRYGELQNAEQKRIAFVTFHQSYEYSDFIEGLFPKVVDGSVTYEVKSGAFREFCEKCGDEPSVFIIDEINRGNISKIMGELITLIEKSKRGSHSATLPLSRESFTVPKNVYLLGTMNTADHSLAMMDSALRRRFNFVPMKPDPDLLPADVKGVNVPQMLRAMNERISWLCDAEHTLGHALFWDLHENMTLEQLGRIFRKNIIPLLQEYFHDDERKMRVVLGRSPMLTEVSLPAELSSWATEWALPNHQYRVAADSEALWNNPDTYRLIYSR